MASEQRSWVRVSVNLKTVKLVCATCLLSSKRKYYFVRNLDNVSEWKSMPTCGMLLQRVSTLKIQLNVLI